MQLLRSIFGVETNQVRWLARLLSLLPLSFSLSILLFNEDVRTSPTVPLVVMGVVNVCVLAAWRWEKIGGLLTLIGAMALWLSIMANSVWQDNFPVGLAALLGAGLSVPFAIIGWLFYSAGRAAGTPGQSDPLDRPRPGPRSVFLQLLGLVALLAVFIAPFLLGLAVTPPIVGRESVEAGPCTAPYPPVGGPVAMPPPIEPLPDSFKGYVLYGYRWEGDAYFSIEVGLNRVRTAGEDFYIEGATFTVQGVDDLKALLRQLPEGEEVIWCAVNRFDDDMVEEIRGYAEGQKVILYVP